MLNKEDNDLLCRVGPGTLMGDFMRQFWLPAVRSDELPAPDCPPLRVMLLGEPLIGFRTTSGAVGLVQSACPHRGASLFFGRNEEEGLRCVYHGWKYDVSGACLDMPSEPAESNFKTKVRAAAYPTRERNGIIWAYMGPRSRDSLPPLPDIEANLLNEEPLRISVLHRRCNWMQGWEGEMDTVHAAFLHGGATKAEDQKPGSFNFYQYRQRSARFSVRDTQFGTSYGAYRPAEDDSYYWRIAHMLFPFYAMIPTGELGQDAKIGVYVPMDDENILHWEIFVRPDGSATGNRFIEGDPRRQQQAGAPGRDVNALNEMLADTLAAAGPQSVRAGNGYLPNTTDWYGRFNLAQSLENDYMIDREAQKNWQSYSGIAGVRQQDMAVTESMGPIYRRWSEHLGTTDALIIRTRRSLLAAAKALRDQGVVPAGVDNPKLYRQRSGEIVLPRDVDWWEATKERRERFAPRALESLNR